MLLSTQGHRVAKKVIKTAYETEKYVKLNLSRGQWSIRMGVLLINIETG